MSAEQVSASSARVDVVKRWLSKPPKGAQVLRLTVLQAEGEPLTLAEWEVADVRPALAQHVVDALSEHAAVAECDAVGQLEYRRGERVLLNRQVRLRYSSEDEPTMNGSLQSQASLAQRHLHEMAKLHTRSMEQVVQQLVRINEQTMRLAERALERLGSVDEEAAELRRAVVDAEAVSVQPTQDVDAMQGEQLKGLVMQVLPLLMQAQIAQPARPNGVPSANGAGAPPTS